MIDTLQTIALWIYVFSLVIGAAFCTFQLDEIRDTIRSGDEKFDSYPVWWKEFQVFLIALIFSTVPLVNTFTTVTGILLVLLNTNDKD